MPATQLGTGQLKDGSIQREDLDTTTAGQAVTRKILAGTGITLTSTGVDAGTGDVTVNAAGAAPSFGTPTLTNSTVIGETVVARWSIPANSLVALNTLGLFLGGQVSSTATLTFRIRFGPLGTIADPQLAATATSVAGVANAHHRLEAGVTMLSATTATATCQSQLAAGLTGTATAAFAAATVNLTVANFLTVTLQQSAAQTYTSRHGKLSL